MEWKTKDIWLKFGSVNDAYGFEWGQHIIESFDTNALILINI